MFARKNVQCSSHSRFYSGHVNVQTIKDVNYFGLQDEFVVSGSDCGHVFVWDRKSTDIVSILHADEDIVNVIEPHPYEPMIAVSGIDYTIKVFSADAKETRRAALGEGIYASLRQRTLAPLVDGFTLKKLCNDEEFSSSDMVDLSGGSDCKGLRSRRRTIDSDHPPTRIYPADLDGRDESEGDALEDEETLDENDI